MTRPIGIPGDGKQSRPVPDSLVPGSWFLFPEFRQKRIMLMFAILAAACSSPPAGEQAPGDTPPPSGTVDKATVANLEAEARALAKTEGCASSGQCKAAPLGAKACGGPRTWLVYCPLTTNESALTQKLDELRTAEERYNRESGMVSDCALSSAPTVESVGGVCRAVP